MAVFDDLRQGIKSIEFLADPTAGEVRIGCSPFLAASFVPAVIDQLSRRCPRIVFHLVATPTVHRELSERNVDLLITRKFDPIADEQMEFETLFTEPYVVAAGAQSPWVRRRRIELAELVNEPWTLPLPGPGSMIGSVAAAAFRARGLDYPPTTVATDSAQARISLVAAGRFLTMLQASILRFSSQQRQQPEIKVLPVRPAIADIPVGVVTLKNRTISPVAQLFIDTAREVAKHLAKKS
jgi:DNA-binding transcriptional LysR family regulator